jgi:hypothetical protein
MRYLLLVSLLLCSVQSPAQHVKRNLLRVVEHVALGAGVEIAVSRTAGGPGKYPAGIVAAGAVAGFKEGADAITGADTKKMAVWHALTILAGAGIAAAVKH